MAFLPTNVAAAVDICMEIFCSLNSRNSCICWYIDLELAGTFRNRVIYIVLFIFSKEVVNLNF